MKTLLALLILTNSFAAIPAFRPETGAVKFVARGKPALIKIEGVGQGPEGKLEKMGDTYKGSFVFRLDTLKTGISLRDEHMKTKYLETEKFPDAKLTFEGVKLAEGQSTFPAKLSLHGVEQMVNVEAEVKGTEGQRKIEAKIPLKLSAFQIAIPSFQGVTVAEDVMIQVEAAESP